jgi:hypothetical protein
MHTILLDIDGVLNPLSDGNGDWVFETHQASDAHATWPVRLSHEMGRAILSLQCRIKWLTTWIVGKDYANPEIGVLLGWGPKGAFHVTEEQASDPLWKQRAVLNFLEGVDGSQKVVWIDDDANLSSSRNLLVVKTNPLIGLTRKHVEQIRAFLKD